MSDRRAIVMSLTETDLNVLAQRFYEASGVPLRSMTDKPLLVAGLRAVFGDLGITILEQDDPAERERLSRVDWSGVPW